MKFMCWESNREDEASATEIDDASDPQDAAQLACEMWERGGSFAGDPIPDPVEVHVRDESGALWLVEVTPEYDVSFYSHKPIAQVLANIEDLQNFQVTDTVWGPKIRRYSFLIGASWTALTPDERRERGQLRDELKRVGFDPGWEQAP